MTIYIVRHGRTAHSGTTEERLDERGIAQAKLTARHFIEQNVRFDACYSGPLRRQVETLELMSREAEQAGARWPAAEVLGELAEAPLDAIVRLWLPKHMGHDPGLMKYYKELASADDTIESNIALTPLFNELLRRWAAGELDAFGFESFESFRARVQGSVARLARAGEGRDVLAVTSMGVIYSMLKFIREGEDVVVTIDGTRFANASITAVDAAGGQLTIASQNLVDHLVPGSLVTYL